MQDLPKIMKYSILIEDLIKAKCEICPFMRDEIVAKPYGCIYDTFSMSGKLKNKDFTLFRDKYGYMDNKSMQELIDENFPFDDMIEDFRNL